jgi:uncharacterized protein YndB with AHSA1/START domain
MGTTETTIDRATFTITFRRTFAAAREDVFEAWTRPEQLAEWWDPTGAKLTACTIDLRVGGAFRFENDGHSPPFVGVYRVVERPGVLVFEAMGAVGTVKLDAEGGTTRMVVTIRCSSADHLDQFIAVGVDVNTAKTFDHLVAFVAKRAA